MEESFKNILVPVDFSINTEVAVKKALELAESDSTIHLFHVYRYVTRGIVFATGRALFDANAVPDFDSIEHKLNEWRSCVADYSPVIKVCTWIVTENSIQKAIDRKVKQLGVDLIIIGKQSYHSWFPFLNTLVPGKLALSTGIPVLTVKPGAMHSKIRTMLVPVTGKITSQRLEVIGLICRKFKVKIYLATFNSDNETPSELHASNLLYAFQRLKKYTDCRVEYTVLNGHSSVKSILTFAKKINADILLLNPEDEIKMGWSSKRVSDILPSGSTVQILAMQ